MGASPAIGWIHDPACFLRFSANMLQNNAPCSRASSRALCVCGRSSNQCFGMFRFTVSRHGVPSGKKIVCPRAQALPGHALPARQSLAAGWLGRQSLPGSPCPGRAWARGLLTPHSSVSFGVTHPNAGIVAVRPDGQWLAAGGFAFPGGAKVWYARTGRLILPRNPNESCRKDRGVSVPG